MRSILCFFTVILSAHCFCSPEYILFPQGKIKWSDTNVQNYSSTNRLVVPVYLSDFEFQNAEVYKISEDGNVLCGTIEKLAATTRAYSFKCGNEVLSTHHSTLLSSGIFLDSTKKYEVHDGAGKSIGYIEGVLYTSVPAEFLFYNETRELFAKAILDKSYSKLTISACNEQPLIVCSKKIEWKDPLGLNHWELDYCWTIDKVADTPFDNRFLMPFLSFISEVWWQSF